MRNVGGSTRIRFTIAAGLALGALAGAPAVAQAQVAGAPVCVSVNGNPEPCSSSPSLTIETGWNDCAPYDAVCVVRAIAANTRVRPG